MFLGTYTTNLDPKGRVVMPAKFREVLRGIEVDRLYLSFNGRHLSAYPPQIWEELHANLYNKITTSPHLDGNLSDYRRYMNSLTSPCNIDKQGRLLIPGELRDKAGITKEAIISGNEKMIDIWSKEGWDKFEQEMQGKLAEMSKDLSAIGF